MNLSAHVIFKGVVALGLVLAATALPAEAAPTDLTEADVRKLMDSFSASPDIHTQTGGDNLYTTLCAGCHMPNGEGATGSGFYPALANNPRLAASAYPLTVVITGLHGMPSFAHRLDDEQIAAVLNYVRTHFGNDYPDDITASQVSELRAQAAPDPWSSYDFNEY